MNSKTKTDRVGKTIPFALTKEAALSFLENNQYARQRERNALHVKTLCRLHDEGSLDGRAVFLVFASLPTGKRHLINGQHVCAAVALTGKTLEVNVSYVDCPDDEDLARLYSIFDSQRKRSQLDALRAVGVLTEMTADQGRALGRAVKVILVGFDRLKQQIVVRKTNYELAKVSEAWLAEALQYFHVVKQDNKTLRRGLYSGQALALGMAGCRFRPDEAERFWSAVSQGDRLPRGSPAKVIREYLLDADGYRTRTHQEKMNVLAQAWNAYHNGDTVKLDPAAKVDEIWGVPRELASEAT